MAVLPRTKLGEMPCHPTISAFESTSKRRKGFPSEQRVKKGYRVVHGSKELIRETRSQRSLSLWFREVVSRTVACAQESSTVQTVTTIPDKYKGRPKGRSFLVVEFVVHEPV